VRVVVCVCDYGIVCEVVLCSMCCDAMTGGVSVCGERHVVGEGVIVGPNGEVQVVLPCSKFCITADSVSSIVSMLV
jgi:hypothetical protein